MKGLYLYCIRQARDSEFLLGGIDGGRVFVVPYCNLEAVVSEVSLEKFSPEEIQKKTEENLEWIMKNAQSHEGVVEEAMNLTGGILGVIPMKFGTIFETIDGLEKLLKKRFLEFEKILKKLSGKQEWAIKIYLDEKLFKEEVKKISPIIKDKEEEIASMPEGMAYFAQKQIDDIFSREEENILQSYVENIFEALKKRAEDGTRGKILGKELTGELLPMVSNASFLVSGKKLDSFEKEINRLNAEYKSIGFIFKYSGPRPPYNFSY